ncbi:MAG: hypothetical protein JWR80_10070 [Bradyrhizobium sp.]|nr:hypothetical protein [Bradyrhizobium sp.]
MSPAFPFDEENMARSPIPVTDREWPEYEYRPFPKQIGLDANGEAIDVNSDDEAAARAHEVVYPKLLGKDKNGKDVIASHPSQEVWMRETVAKPKVDPSVSKAEQEQAERDAAELARKAAAYDEMMAAQSAKTPDKTAKPGKAA